MSSASDQFASFFSRVACWLWETVELVLIIVLDCLERLIELVLAVTNLIFQVTARARLPLIIIAQILFLN